MLADDLRRLLRQHPFQPLRFHLSDGAEYEIRHPELALVTFSLMQINLPQEGKWPPNLPGIPEGERVVHVSLMHVVRVEVLADPVNPQLN